METQLVHQFNYGRNDAFYIRLKEYKDKRYIDFRVFFQPKGYPEMVPTKKGLMVNAEFLAELKKGILACEKELAGSVN